jgi:ubiquinone/menaquinone biosynthesis C-methylase UbiE
MSNKIYKGTPEQLRLPERIARLDIERVSELCLEGIYVTKMLDVGTGSGVFAEAFALRNINVTGIDSSSEMVAMASKQVPDAVFKEGTAESLPFKNKSFDLVFLGTVLHESDDPVLALKEAKRVATSRVAVLEWPYIDEPFGPPLSHRLLPETVREFALKAGLDKFEVIPLSHTVLYRIEVTSRLRTDNK